MQTKINLRQEIILTIRGFFLTPVIATLAKENFFKKNINKNFVVKKKKLRIVVMYLVNLGLIHQKKNEFRFSELGKKLFKRSGSFNIVHSYRKYLFNLDKIIKHIEKPEEVSCDRKENVLGSGTTNFRKFFNPGLKLIKDKDFDIIHDIGCGDGNFLTNIKKIYKNKIITGSDLSKISIEQTKKNIKDKSLKLIKADALDVDKWIGWLKKSYNMKNKKLLISIWFIIHEISNKDVNKIIHFFKKIHKEIPSAKILMGEIVEPEKKLLDNNKYNSIMPEYMFFHQLSGQGIFNYKELKLILSKIPYACKKEIKVDTIRYQNKKNPSAIVWLLEPKN
tara:strand:+ start:1038 stop:2042 length:1005 start_codon:yes stop_codon:yes gene_type:complete